MTSICIAERESNRLWQKRAQKRPINRKPTTTDCVSSIISNFSIISRKKIDAVGKKEVINQCHTRNLRYSSFSSLGVQCVSGQIARKVFKMGLVQSCVFVSFEYRFRTFGFLPLFP